MKKLIGIFLLVAALSVTSSVQAQDTSDSKVKKAGKEVEKGAKKAGNKTAEVASKGKSKVTQTVYKDKVGPNGETIYIDKNGKYYWIDKKGHNQYIEAGKLKDKEKVDQ